MRPFSNIIPNFAANLHLLVDSIDLTDYQKSYKIARFSFCSMDSFS